MAKKLPYRKIALSNGLTVILYPISSVQSVFATLYVRTGVVYESKNNNGISHFTEHLIHQGTQNFPQSRALSEALESQGILENGGTGQSETFFWIKTPSLKTEKALELLHELVFKPTLPAERIEIVRQTILNEYQDFWRHPENQFWQAILAKRFTEKGLSYIYDPLGSSENIKNFNRQTVVAWRKKFHCPANMILSVAGNFSEKQITSWLKKIFKQGAKTKPAEEPRYKTGGYSNFLIYHQPAERDQIQFMLSFPTFGWKEASLEERLTLSLLGPILGGGPVSRLFKVLREDKGLVYSVSFSYTYFTWRGMSFISGSTSKENLLTTIELINSEIKKVLKEGFNSNEINRGKNILNSHISFRFESPESITNYLAREEFDKGDILLPDGYISAINKITKQQLNKLARKIFNFSKLNIGLLGKLEDSQIKGIKKIFGK